MNEDKQIHLQMIQDVISRMAANTFLIKGWSITAIGAMYAFWLKERIHGVLFLTLALTIFFWGHDAYYLYLERAFRNFYDEARKNTNVNFEIKPIFKEKLRNVIVRPILLYSYGLLLIINLILLYMDK